MVVVETIGDPLTFVEAFRDKVRAVDPNIPLQSVRTMEAHFRDALWLHRLGAGIGGVISVLSILLSAAGLYGVMSFTLRARQHEMGIRRALGAGRPQVLGLAVRGAFRMTLWGLLLGAILSGLAGLGMRAALPVVDPWDPAAGVQMVVLILAVGLVAGLVPGLAASRVDPIVALNVEG
jgi:putative ABC transport system permease protein